MNDANIPLTKDVVLVGGGHTHALLLLSWAMNPLPGTRVTIINPSSTAPYTGMLPGHVAGHYDRHELDIDISRLAHHAGARHVHGHARDIDTEAGLIHLDGRPPVEYDVLSMNIGIHSGMTEIPGSNHHGHPAKPLDVFAREWEQFVSEVRKGRKPHVAVIGAGVAGVELAMAMEYRLRKTSIEPVSVRIFEQAATPMNELGSIARRKILRLLEGNDISLECGVSVRSLNAGMVVLSDGHTHDVEFVVLSAGSKPHEWLKDTGLANDQGYVPVDSCLRAIGYKNIFAAGDCAHFTPSPLPKAGVYAVRQAPVLHDNLRAVLQDREPRSYRPQKHFLKLISTGTRHAVGSKYGLTIFGASVWQLKDRIDRRFMNRFVNLPAMKPPHVPTEVAEGAREIIQGTPAICRGCGSKVGHDVLREILGSRIQHGSAKEALTGLDDAALLEIDDHKMMISTDFLNSFIEDHWVFARIAALHAVSDIWAMGATPSTALLTIVLPRMNRQLQQRTLAETMHALQTTLGDEGIEIIGGHTCQGTELSIGLTVLGELQGKLMSKAGAMPGDDLVMTKPIGTGVILAGLMTGQTRGHDLHQALNSMQASSAPAAGLLGQHASAMTDITGFGLAGHLYELLDASGCAAILSLDKVPLLPGALSLAAMGVRSSIWESNTSIMPGGIANEDHRADLLFDPQTSGGLLAAIPADRTEDVLELAGAQGIDAWQIGRIEPGPTELFVK